MPATAATCPQHPCSAAHVNQHGLRCGVCDGNQRAPAETRDAPAIARVHVRSWQIGYREFVADAVLDALSVAERERDWSSWLGDGRSSTLVAELGGAVAGFATTITPSRDEDAGPGTCELAALYVQPERARRGIGRALLREAMDAARSRGSHDIVAWVLAANAAARAFYDQFAFMHDGAQQLHARTDQTAIRLRASLDA